MEVTVEVTEVRGMGAIDPCGFNRVAYKIGIDGELNDQYNKFGGKYSLNVEFGKIKRVRVEVWNQHENKLKGYVVCDASYSGVLTSRNWYTVSSTSDVTGELCIFISWSLKAHKSILENHQQRMVRVFLSSTFLDMHEEREVIMRKVMVQLSQFCYDRGVSLTYIDMRWGITKEMGDKAETIIACLQEVDHSRPYFVGILGERYGWHQEVDGRDELLTKTFEIGEVEYQWINKLRTKSVTELEIQHGFLLHPSMSVGHTLFFFRDPNYINTIKETERSRFKDTTRYAIDQMASLKQQIRERADKGDCILHENYENPEHLGELLLADLKEFIQADYPILNNKLLLRKQNEHTNYARQRSEAFVVRPKYLVELNSTLRDCEVRPGSFILVTGESGSGKSALLAYWWQTTISSYDNSNKRLFAHFIGASFLASNFSSMLIRLFEEINDIAVHNETAPIPIPTGERELLVALPKFLDMASFLGGLIIIIDAVNQLQAHYHELHWLPLTLPPRVHVIVSCVPDGTTLTAVKKRGINLQKGEGWKLIEIQPLEESERKDIITKRLGLYGKKIMPDVLDKVAKHPCAALPLFLTTVLSELCTIGHHRKFGEQVEQMLKCDNLSKLFEIVISRWEENFEKDLVREVLLLILASRSGVTESTIQALTKANKDKWDLKALYTAKADQLVSECGTSQQSREKTAASLSQLGTFLQQRAGVFNEAKRVTEQALKLFESLNDQHGIADSYYNLGECSIHLGKLEAAGKMHKKALKVRLNLFGEYHPEVATSCNYLGRLWHQQGNYDKAKLLAAKGLTIRLKLFGEVHAAVAESYNELGHPLAGLGNLEDARRMFENGLQIRRQLFGEQHPTVAESYTNLARLNCTQGLYHDALSMAENSLSIHRNLFGGTHHLVAHSLSVLAHILDEQGKYPEAIEKYEDALDVKLKLFGELHPDVATNYGHLGGLLYQQGNHELATEVLEKALDIHLALSGENHREVARIYDILAVINDAQGRPELAEELLDRALGIKFRLFEIAQAELEEVRSGSPEVADALNNLARYHSEHGKKEFAVELLEMALDIREKLLQKDHDPSVALSYTNLGLLFEEMGDLEKAKEMFKNALFTCRKLYGEYCMNTANAYDDFAGVFSKQQLHEQAEELLDSALRIRLAMFGELHRDVAASYDSLSECLSAQKKDEFALELLERALEVRKRLYGENNAYVANSYSNLGHALFARGDRAGAKLMWEQAVRILVGLVGEDHPTVKGVAKNLICLWISRGSRKKGQEEELKEYLAALGITTSIKLTDQLVKKQPGKRKLTFR